MARHGEAEMPDGSEVGITNKLVWSVMTGAVGLLVTIAFVAYANISGRLEKQEASAVKVAIAETRIESLAKEQDAAFKRFDEKLGSIENKMDRLIFRVTKKSDGRTDE